MTIPITVASDDAITKAADLIQQGQLVAFPTETVYGLGANALDEKAVTKIYHAKGRPSSNPLICHVASIQMAQEFGHFNDIALQCAHSFWPGGLTLVVPLKPGAHVAKNVTAGLDSIALRMPNQKIALNLLQKSGCPIAAPSANKSGSISPTKPGHVATSLDSGVSMILAGGACTVGLESTILDCRTQTPKLLRPGAVTREDIEQVIGQLQQGIENPTAPSAPGQLLKHYAPAIPLRMNADAPQEGEAFLAFGPKGDLIKADHKLNLSPTGDLAEAAANLFTMLHELDISAYRGIAVMPIPQSGLGIAINDRLKRASAPN